MNKIALFTLLVICGSVFADECTALNTQATCTGNTNCNYTITGGKCDNKCTGLVKTDCENSINSPNCESNAEKCDVPLACNTLQDKKADCQGNNACTWVDTIEVDTCNFKNKDTTTATCDGKKKDKRTCEANGMCTYTAATFKSCDYQENQCTSKNAVATCDTKFCTMTATVCKLKIHVDCANHSTQQNCASAGTSCTFTDGKCVTICSTFLEDATCESNSLCQINSTFSCADNKDKGQEECQKTNTNAECTSAFCQKTQSAACLVVDTYCSAKTATDCNNDTDNCQLNTPTPSQCNNKATARDCNLLKSKTHCEARTGCSWSAYSCSNKATKSCLATDKEADCTAAAKFCAYTSNGTCEAKSNNFILSAVGSLLATLLLL